MLYPKNTSTRTVINLDGMWEFKLGNGTKEFEEDIAKSLITDGRPMPVPSSYNDIYEDIKDYFGWVYYQRKFQVSDDLKGKDLVLRFDAVTHWARVYLNGEEIAKNKGGFLPFEVEIQDKIKKGENILTVACSNIINYETLPVGGISNMLGALMGADSTDVKGEQTENNPNFDFFNYAGINRHVRLYTRPKNYIEDITLTNEINGDNAKIFYKLDGKNLENAQVYVYDEDGNLLGKSQGSNGEIEIKNVRKWEVLDAYLYKVKVVTDDDEYDIDYGIREIEVKDGNILLNKKPLYLKGFGKHEDSFPNGRGMNEVLYYKDLSLMKSMGANSFRTSHYPYSEEMMMLCDRMGFLVIDETPAVGINGSFGGGANFNGQKLGTFDPHGIGEGVFDHHKDVIRDLIKRDKNHACVIMWSIANEPDSASDGAYEYFKPLFDLAKDLDPEKRPCTLVSVQTQDPKDDVTAKLSDVICLNRYYGWYFGGPDLEKPLDLFRKELEYWQSLNKPVLITEYGADTIPGMHDTNQSPTMYSEEYQVQYYKANNKVMDEFDCVVGEHPWNFADFATSQGLLRIGGNKKGIFTRDRKPKLAAHYFKERWLNIDNNFDKKDK